MQAMASARRRCGIGKMLFQQDDGGAARLCDVIRAYVAACERRRRKSGGTLANAAALSLSLGRPYHSRLWVFVFFFFGCCFFCCLFVFFFFFLLLFFFCVLFL